MLLKLCYCSCTYQWSCLIYATRLIRLCVDVPVKCAKSLQCLVYITSLISLELQRCSTCSDSRIVADELLHFKVQIRFRALDEHCLCNCSFSFIIRILSIYYALENFSCTTCDFNDIICWSSWSRKR
jgi:hypothetical protein